MAQLNQAQRKRAFELIDEKVNNMKGLKEEGSKKLFMLSVVNRKLKFSAVDLLERLVVGGYYESTNLDLMELLDLTKEWDNHKEVIQTHNKEKRKTTNALVQQLKDEITFGTELSIIQDALNRLDEHLNE